MFILAIAIGAVVIALGVIVFIGITIYTSVMSLTLPSLLNVFLAFSGNGTINFTDCLILAIEGAIAGLFVGCITKAFKFKSKTGKSFLSELFSLGAFKGDPTFLSTLILQVLVGAVVGWWAGIAGSAGFTSLFGDYSTHAHDIVGAIVASGGPGGIGSGGGVYSPIFFLILLIVIIFVVQGMIVGALSGLTFGMLVGAISNAIRGGGVSSMLCLVEERGTSMTKGELISKATKKGVIEGAIVGGIVGLIQGIITAVAFRDKLHH
jgi:hypothetical protein